MRCVTFIRLFASGDGLEMSSCRTIDVGRRCTGSKCRVVVSILTSPCGKHSYLSSGCSHRVKLSSISNLRPEPCMRSAGRSFVKTHCSTWHSAPKDAQLPSVIVSFFLRVRLQSHLSVDRGDDKTSDHRQASGGTGGITQMTCCCCWWVVGWVVGGSSSHSSCLVQTCNYTRASTPSGARGVKETRQIISQRR